MTLLPESVAHAMHEMAVPATPDAAFLSAVLRAGPSGEHWPAGFRWYYGDCSTCAIGLAKELWTFVQTEKFDRVTPVISAFGLSDDDADTIFMDLGHHLGKYCLEVTPADVADAIDDALATPVSK